MFRRKIVRTFCFFTLFFFFQESSKSPATSVWSHIILLCKAGSNYLRHFTVRYVTVALSWATRAHREGSTILHSARQFTQKKMPAFFGGNYRWIISASFCFDSTCFAVTRWLWWTAVFCFFFFSLANLWDTVPFGRRALLYLKWGSCCSNWTSGRVSVSLKKKNKKIKNGPRLSISSPGAHVFLSRHTSSSRLKSLHPRQSNKVLGGSFTHLHHRAQGAYSATYSTDGSTHSPGPADDDIYILPWTKLEF